MPQMDNKQQTMMWQQNQYMGDSGIQSGATTQAPSVSSKQGLDDMDAATPGDMDTSQMIFDLDQVREWVNPSLVKILVDLQ